MKKILRKMGMTLLFMCALYVTVSSITNVHFHDVYRWLFTSSTDSQAPVTIMTISENTKQQKHLKPIKADQKHEKITSMKALAEAAHVKQYPEATVIATGYTAGMESTGKTPQHPEYGITYSGVKVTRDLYSTIAADLGVYPIGTILWIPDYGFGVVADKGSAITGNKIDLYYKTVQDVYDQWGKRKVKVHVIKMGDGNLSQEELQQLNQTKTLQVFRQQITES